MSVDPTSGTSAIASNSGVDMGGAGGIVGRAVLGPHDAPEHRPGL